ncbi:hypothetical protein [Streptomyces sp. NBC_01314]|uniref:hypothetical protein n=1 Tax=Streptomyces sp. NBC_01314 TaxID=2903821 RepID=UPI0030900BE3|nr:hypothetical protein OG622_28365 [Streptomyces sp. NBC_01314]
MRARSQRPQLPETSAAQRKANLAWNKGLTGASRTADDIPLFHTCAVPGCGRCAAIDRARADLRTNGHEGGVR